MQGTRTTCSALLFLMATAVAHAQARPSEGALNNEVGLVIGATETPSVGLQRGDSVHLNSAFTLGAEYDRRIVGRRIALYAGVDFLATPFDVKASFPRPDITPQYAYVFITPHVRVKFHPDAALQPWLEFGGGYANFAPSQPRASAVRVTGDGVTGTYEFGGGIDTKPLIHPENIPLIRNIPIIKSIPVGARFEARDFYSGQPHYGVATSSSSQNNVVLTGGLLLRF